jgi:hypothetical protein
MRYQQFAFHAYCGAAGPVSKMASQQEKVFCAHRFEVSRSVITVQIEFRGRFKQTHHTRIVSFYAAHEKHAALKSRIWTPQNGAHRKPSPHLGPAVSMRSELLVFMKNFDNSRC